MIRIVCFLVKSINLLEEIILGQVFVYRRNVALNVVRLFGLYSAPSDHCQAAHFSPQQLLGRKINENGTVIAQRLVIIRKVAACLDGWEYFR